MDVQNIKDELIQVNGARLYTKSCGEGEPMLIIHGGPGLDHSYLLPHLYGLSNYFNLIFYDQRASGKSSADLPFTIETFVEDIESIRNHYGISQLHLMGHSWGGYLAMKYALKYPERLHSLILLNSMAPSDSLRLLELNAVDSLESAFYQPEIDTIINSQEYKLHQAVAFEKLFRVMFKKDFYDPQRVSELTLTFPEAFFDNSLKLQSMNPEMETYNIIPELRQLPIPSLIFYGVDEPAAEIIGPVLWENIEGSELIILPRCGHFPFIEQPTRLFEKIISFTNYL